MGQIIRAGSEQTLGIRCLIITDCYFCLLSETKTFNTVLICINYECIFLEFKI